MDEVQERYQLLVGMQGKIHHDWRLWLFNEIHSLEQIMKGREGVAYQEK